MRIAFYTLGCKVNQYETDLLKEKSVEAGYLVVDFDEKADIYCINSCSVTNMSDRKTRQAIAKSKKKNEDAVIAILGCTIQGKKENLSEFHDVNILLGNDEKLRLIEILDDYDYKKKPKYISVGNIEEEKEYKDKSVLVKGTESREEVKIEDGCDNFCSYCIIPYIRGRVRSRALEEIYKEAKSLVENGVKEIILVGIEVASYGKDLSNVSLINVVNELAEIKGLARIRLSSIEPRFLTEKNIIALSKVDKLCPHFHISMQSGNTEVLKRMNRKYNKEKLIEVCNNIHKYFKDAYIAADVIVGFPNETDEEFKDTIDTINRMGLTEVHVFKYSKRKFTRAAKMDEQIDGVTKKQRSNEILEISRKRNKEFLKKWCNKKVSVLFENATDGYLTGLTPNYMKVKVEGDDSLCGTIQDVEITSLEKDILIGSLR